MSTTNQQKLYQLLQDNNLDLSLADLIEYTYHTWADNYLTISKAAEHLEGSTKKPMAESVDQDLEAVINLGKRLYLANL